MTEKELIAKLHQLKRIKPSQNWVVLAKNRILEEEQEEHQVSGLFSLFLKPVLSGVFVFIMIIGIFAVSQDSLPGELLYPLKKITERSRALLLARNDLPRYELEKANKRLKEISRMVQEDGTAEPLKKLDPAINEFKQNVSRAVKTLAKVQATSSDPFLLKKIVEETKKLEENKQKVEQLGIAVGQTEELNSVLANIAAREIEQLKTAVLSQEQMELFGAAKQEYDNRDYGKALEYILLMSYPQLQNNKDDIMGK